MTDNSISLQLFHHTKDDVLPKIIESGYLRLSPWNIQGNQELSNIGYVYFTSLRKIRDDADLNAIAMASDGEILLVRDNFTPPDPLPKGWRSTLVNEILVLPVYRESTRNRTSTLAFWVDSASLSPQHLLKHSPDDGAVWYEVCGPKIFRVGLEPGSILPFDSSMNVVIGIGKRFDYAILGDARYMNGLYAPFNEENTASISKVHIKYKNIDMLTFWMNNSNQDHFSKITPELQTLVPSKENHSNS